MLALRTLSLMVLCCGFVFSSLPVSAQEEKTDEANPAKLEGEMPGTLTGSVSLNSDYIFRGISQTSNGPAIMGDADWEFKTGFEDLSAYVGTFASNVDFPGSNANLEVDFIGGVRGVVHNIDWDAGLSYYKYFGATSSLNYDYYEFIAKISRDLEILKLSGQVGFSPDYTGATGAATYLEGRVDKTLPYDFSAFATLGYQWIDDNTNAGTPDYTNWSLGVSRPIWKFNVSAMYTDTDLSKGECYEQAYGNVCSARGVVSVGLEF